MTTPPPHYELLYHPGQPGRGEFIRLAFAAAEVPYTDLANEDPSAGYATVRRICMNSGVESADGNPPVFAPPALRMTRGGGDETAGKKKKSLVISQTPNILLFLGPRLGLVPGSGGGGGEDEDEDEAEAQRFHVQQLMLTALDFNNEMHDTHHPISVVK
jgi:glutathione S-transferase